MRTKIDKACKRTHMRKIVENVCSVSIALLVLFSLSTYSIPPDTSFVSCSMGPIMS